MKMKTITLFFWMFCLGLAVHAQDTTAVEEDFSQFADEFDVASVDSKGRKTKSYCNNKVTGLSPTKLISIGYDWQGSYNMTSKATDLTNVPSFPNGTQSSGNVLSTGGLRFGANFPIISRNNIIVNLGANYWESRYRFENSSISSNQFQRTLNDFGLRTAGVQVSVFKPLDEKRFVIAQLQGDVNGNFNFGDVSPDLSLTKYSGALLYGWKFNDRTSFAFGVVRTYRGGELLHIPAVLYNKTFNSKWGVEILAPARGHVRRTFSARSMLLAGWEIEGQSYHIQFRDIEAGRPSPFGGSRFDQAELRRAELRFRMIWEKQISGFIWFSFQGGYRYNFRYNVAESDGAGRGNFVIENALGNPLYFQFSLNLVSP